MTRVVNGATWEMTLGWIFWGNRLPDAGVRHALLGRVNVFACSMGIFIQGDDFLRKTGVKKFTFLSRGFNVIHVFTPVSQVK
jgi:hypothetical protein